MYAYCENNPVNRVDPSGTIAPAIPVVAGVVAFVLLTIAAGVILLNPASQKSITAGISKMVDSVNRGFANIIDRIQEIPKAEEKEKDITTTPSKPSPTVIYRYYASKTENLAPRPDVDYDGLSFSTRPPRPGVPAVVTTIEEVNATGTLMAFPTSRSHVLVVPVNGTVKQWMDQGQSSIWSRQLSSIVVEWDG